MPSLRRAFALRVGDCLIGVLISEGVVMTVSREVADRDLLKVWLVFILDWAYEWLKSITLRSRVELNMSRSLQQGEDWLHFD